MSNAKSKPWIRLYRESLHDPKIVSLTDRQHRAWHNLLLIADDNGKLPSMRDIAVHLRMSAQDAEQLVCDLVEAELIDTDALNGSRTYEIHGWASRQFTSDSSTERVRKHRETRMKRFNETARNVTVTPPDTESDTDTDSEKDQTRERARGGGDLDECKVAFNGSTESMIAEVQSAMGGGQADRRCAEQWLANLLRTHGQQAVQGGFQALLTAKTTGGVMPRPLNYWSGAAAKIATKPQEPQAKKRLTAAEYMAEQRKLAEAAR